MIIYLIYKDNSYPLYSESQYRLGQNEFCDIILPLDEEVILRVEDDKVYLLDEEYTSGLYDIVLYNNTSIKLLILKENRLLFKPKDILYISGSKDATIQLEGIEEDILFNFKDENFIEIISENSFFLNGHRANDIKKFIENDIILFEKGFVISIGRDFIDIASSFEIQTNLLPYFENSEEDRGRDFHRSPRIILREPESKITIAQAPVDDESSRQSLIKLIITPLAMVIFTVIIYLISKSNVMIFMMMGMSLITIGTSVHSYFSDKKTFSVKKEEKLKAYLEYLDTKYKELSACKDEQVQALTYHYPNTDKIIDMAKKIDRRIYEKIPNDFDFLTYRLGTGEVKANFQINYTEAELTKYNKEAGDKVKELLNYYQTIDDVPIHNVIESPIGYIGNRKVVIEQLQQLMIQISAFHSYHDIEFIPIFREDEFEDWNWGRWLPHTKLKAFNCRSFIYNQKTRDQILTSLYQIIKDRKHDYEKDNGKEKSYFPKYIFLITDLSFLLDHNIMEYINEDLSLLGIYYIFAEEVIESLSEHVKTVVDYRGDKKAKLILQNGEFMNQDFCPLTKISLSEKENFARYMAGINHIQTLRNSIPDSITFLEMYGVSHVEELNLLDRWSKNETYQTMEVPLGVRGRDDILYLNIHEKAHGPHGLIAGTTGSGKSELVQSYILSLAVNYHPYEVAFLLIDYKGGGMANLFADLPHVVGTITNLDGNQANRALISIKAELKKRQRIFLENNVNHINQYMKLFKEGKVTEPLPHLLIISDEFAELKANQPDFMDELVSTARIGRSLGVKLILATQKPSGVVNDQIWSNSKFKIALKVQDVADSREVIKTPDAAEITQTGRAYLQVGNNEIYELFQSAWSGAEYNPDGEKNAYKEKTIYEITNNGQYFPINKDLSGLSATKEVKSIPTELDAIVENAHKTFESLNISKVASPWLPPLADKVYAKDLQSIDFKDYWEKQDDDMDILVGYQDLPENQEQSPLYFNIDRTGHILLVGSPGFGKSTFLRTFAVDIMRKKTPAEAHFYLYDFGANGLVSLSDFPHVADYFILDENEKILKSLRRLNKMVKERKKALSSIKATNLKQYNELSKDKFPSVFLFIDGFDGVTDSPFGDRLYDVLNVIARDGASIGIYLVVTLSRLNAMRLQLQTNFKTKISLFLFDNSDLSGVVGRSNIFLDEIKGRAITKFDSIISFQVVLPYESEEYSDYIKSINKEVKDMKSVYTGTLPEKIPMLPDVVTTEYLSSDFSTDNFVFGLEKEFVKPAFFSFNKAILMAADGSSSINNYYKLLDYNLKRLENQYNIVILDLNKKVSENLFKGANRFTSSSEIADVFKTIIKDLKERINSKEVDYKKWLILIPEISPLVMSSDINEDDFKLLVTEGYKYGVIPIFVGEYLDLVNNTFDTYVSIVRKFVNQVFLGIRISDQVHTRYPFINNEPALKPNQGYILYPDKYELIQLMEIYDD